MSSKALSQSDIDAIEIMMNEWTTAMVNQDWSQWQQYWDEDGVLMPPDHERVVGRAELVDFVSGVLGSVKSFEFSDWTFDGMDDLAVVTNTIRIEMDDPDSPLASDDQMILLRRHEDGNWRVHKVIFNSSGAV